MHPRITELLDHLAAGRQELLSAVESVPAGARQTRPSADAWSVAEVVGHLAVTERAVSRMMAQKIADARERGLGAETETTSVVNPRHVATVRDRSRKITASESSLPRSGLSADAALHEFEQAHSAVCDVITQADGLALGEIKAPHRVFGELDLYGWYEFLGSHEMRHAAQIREIGAALGSAAA